jgi:uncharacterized Zn finger protein (UPF0148 family)
MTCTNCGLPLTEGDAFCGNCGQPVSVQTASEPPVPGPASAPANVSASATLIVGERVAPPMQTAAPKSRRIKNPFRMIMGCYSPPALGCVKEKE